MPSCRQAQTPMHRYTQPRSVCQRHDQVRPRRFGSTFKPSFSGGQVSHKFAGIWKYHVAAPGRKAEWVRRPRRRSTPGPPPYQTPTAPTACPARPPRRPSYVRHQSLVLNPMLSHNEYGAPSPRMSLFAIQHSRLVQPRSGRTHAVFLFRRVRPNLGGCDQHRANVNPLRSGFCPICWAEPAKLWAGTTTSTQVEMLTIVGRASADFGTVSTKTGLASSTSGFDHKRAGFACRRPASHEALVRRVNGMRSLGRPEARGGKHNKAVCVPSAAGGGSHRSEEYSAAWAGRRWQNPRRKGGQLCEVSRRQHELLHNETAPANRLPSATTTPTTGGSSARRTVGCAVAFFPRPLHLLELPPEGLVPPRHGRGGQRLRVTGGWLTGWRSGRLTVAVDAVVPEMAVLAVALVMAMTVLPVALDAISRALTSPLLLRAEGLNNVRGLLFADPATSSAAGAQG